MVTKYAPQLPAFGGWDVTQSREPAKIAFGGWDVTQSREPAKIAKISRIAKSSGRLGAPNAPEKARKFWVEQSESRGVYFATRGGPGGRELKRCWMGSSSPMCPVCTVCTSARAPSAPSACAPSARALLHCCASAPCARSAPSAPSARLHRGARGVGLPATRSSALPEPKNLSLPWRSWKSWRSWRPSGSRFNPRPARRCSVELLGARVGASALLPRAQVYETLVPCLHLPRLKFDR